MSLLWALLIIPAACALVAPILPSGRAILGLGIVGSAIEAALAAFLVPQGMQSPVYAAGQQLMLDPLSAYNLALVVAIFFMSSLYAWSYFSPQIQNKTLGLNALRRFGASWFAFLASMVLVLVANNMGLMWVAMEATTLASALLVCMEFRHSSVRASWTYLIICSVGIALALLGTFLFCGEAQRLASSSQSPFLWTDLVQLAPRMRPEAAKLAFLFLLVGYGTKAGLAPMHTWLPDAHSQAPTPVSAVLSGVLLNCALYCIARFLPLADAATGKQAWAFHLLIPFGLISIALAAVFIVRERDIKRLFAFSSVEHIGIIALGFGVGGTAAALYHTFNHSVCKMLAFFCAGKLVQRYGTQDMRRMGGLFSVIPLAGTGLVLGMLTLVGAPPFSIFMSELWIVRSGLAEQHTLAVVLFLVGAAVVFLAVIRHAVQLLYQPQDKTQALGPSPKALDWPLVLIPLALLILVGVWMPPELAQALEKAASVVRGS